MRLSPKAIALPIFVWFSVTLFAQQQGPEKWSARVYPNPSDGIVNVELTGKHDELTHINVVDMNGKSIFWKNILNDRTHTFDLTDIPKGNYMVLMMSTNVYMKQPLIIR